MNYILNKIENKINILNGLGEIDKTKPYYQAKLEYFLINILAFLWNKNIENLSITDKEYVVNTIIKPSIGSIVSTARTLDINKEVFGNKKIKNFYKSIDEYPRLRNERLGHGYSFEDSTAEIIEIFNELSQKIEEESEFYGNYSHDLIQVLKYESDLFSGIRYKSDGTQVFWSCPAQVYMFTKNNIYTYSDKFGYNRVSPFIDIENDNFYIFSSVEEKLTGRVKYNQILKTGKKTAEYDEFATFVSYSDSIKSISANGTIITRFEKYFKRYIDVGISVKILNFLLKNNSSVFATIWGYGGVGKTSAVQNVCDNLSHRERKKFDYIIFLSAKDRYYNYYKGKIETIDTKITSLENIIQLTNKIVFTEDEVGINKIVDYDGKMLLVIDDFETFSKIERDRIIDFIKKLNINHHKVIITTRSATLITGEEIQANELNKEETFSFLIQALKNEIPTFDVVKNEKDINKYIDSIWLITSGRPLFILQFAVLLGQKGAVTEVINVNIRELPAAKNFLYDRIYDYLSINGKSMFLAISLLANKDDLTGLVKNLRFVMNMEDTSIEEFDLAFSELSKLKLVIRESDELFKVYSNDVLQIMSEHYSNKGPELKTEISSRFHLISTSKYKDLDYALLEVADSKRIIASEAEIENLYRRILNRDKTPLEIKVKAIINFANYLVSFKQNILKTLKLLKDYFYKFGKDNSSYISVYSKYSWAEGSEENRYFAMKLITDYISTRPSIDEKIYLELLSNLMTYSTVMAVNKRELLKNKYRFNEITKQEFTNKHNSQKERFIEVYKYPGNRIFQILEDKNLKSYAANTRSVILDGLIHYCEVCTRLKKYSKVKKVAQKVFDELPLDYHEPFTYKLEVINRIQNPLMYDRFGRKKPDSEFGTLLKSVIQSKK